MDDWLSERATVLGLSLSDEDAGAILDLARIAAHESGERTNAPLLCYLVGIAVGRGRKLDELVETVS